MSKCSHNWLNYRSRVVNHQWTKWYRCKLCGVEKIDGDPTLGEVRATGTPHIPGYNAPGYNEGLGEYVSGKKEWREKAKQKGFNPVG